MSIITNLALYTVAFLWGIGFILQKISYDYVDAFTYNGTKFISGGLVTFLMLLFSKAKVDRVGISITQGMIIGLMLFLASITQQIGLKYTTTGNAAFITVMYIILVPLILIMKGRKVNKLEIACALSAFIGMYFMSKDASLNSMKIGDLLVFVSAIFWSVHTIYIGYLGNKCNLLILATTQFFTTGMLSLIFAPMFSDFHWLKFDNGLLISLISGVAIVGIAYTLQIYVLKYTNPTYASIIFSLEGVIAFVIGVFLLSEPHTPKVILGAVIILASTLTLQIKNKNSSMNY